MITADVVHFEAARLAFDRVVSVEMFEHMKNYQARPPLHTHLLMIRYIFGRQPCV